MDLTPWNQYVLLAAFLLLVVYGILTIPHLRKLSRAMQNLQPALAAVQDHSQKLNQDTAWLRQRSQQRKDAQENSRFRKYVTAAVLIYNIIRDYRQAPEKGLRQAGRSSVRVLTSRQMRRRVMDQIGLG